MLHGRARAEIQFYRALAGESVPTSPFSAEQSRTKCIELSLLLCLSLAFVGGIESDFDVAAAGNVVLHYFRPVDCRRILMNK